MSLFTRGVAHLISHGSVREKYLLSFNRESEKSKKKVRNYTCEIFLMVHPGKEWATPREKRNLGISLSFARKIFLNILLEYFLCKLTRCQRIVVDYARTKMSNFAAKMKNIGKLFTLFSRGPDRVF